jgi:serine/threonine protein kinase
VLVKPDGHLVLLDFGLVVSQPEGMSSTGERIIGTVAYMSPEQAAGELLASAYSPIARCATTRGAQPARTLRRPAGRTQFDSTGAPERFGKQHRNEICSAPLTGMLTARMIEQALASTHE